MIAMNSTSEERQKAINECERLRDKAQEQLNTLFDNPTQEGYEKLSKYLSEQVSPDYSKVEKLIDKWKGLQ